MEMVDSEDDVRTSLSIRGISMPNFEVLDARIASALNRIIHAVRKHETARHAERGTQRVCRPEHTDVTIETVNRDRLGSTRLRGTVSGGRRVSVVLDTLM